MSVPAKLIAILWTPDLCAMTTDFSASFSPRLQIATVPVTIEFEYTR